MSSERLHATKEKPTYSRSSILLPLTIILIAGIVLRVWNINFDQGIGSHPDERSTSCFYAPTIGLPSSFEQFTDPTQSPLNPLWDVEQQARRSFTYGHFPLYLGVGMAYLFTMIAPLAESIGASPTLVQFLGSATAQCEGYAVAGRLTIAILDTVTILLIFLLGSRLGLHVDAQSGQRRKSPMLGLIAAAFYALTAQAIQLSHFFAMDPASTTFTVMAVLGAVGMVQDRTASAAIVTGLGMGLAIASKFSALPILALPVVAVLLVLRQNDVMDSHSGKLTDGSMEGSSSIQAIGVTAHDKLTVVFGAFASLIIAAFAFLITSPYAVLDYENFIQATLIEQGRMVRGIADLPFTRQYRNTVPYLYFIEQQIRWGMWWPLGLIAAAGTLWKLIDLFRGIWIYLVGVNDWESSSTLLTDQQTANIVIWAWLVPYFGLTGAFLAKFNRYMSPVLPFVLLFGAALIWHLWGYERDRETSSIWVARRGIATLLAIIGIGGGLFWSAAYVNGIYNTEHPWITASRWVYENVPAESVILWELWDDPIPKNLEEPGMDMGSARLRHIDWSPYEEDTAEKYEILKEKLRAADYVIYSSKRIYDSVDELPERYPMTILYYEGMWNGSLGYELAFDVSTPPSLFGFTFEDRFEADESWSLYDHPQVSIFRKTKQLTDSEFDDYFQRAWERAIPWYRGEDSPISGFLNVLGLGNSPESENRGLINKIIALIGGTDGAMSSLPPVEERTSLMLERPLVELPVVDNYRWNRTASESTPLAIAWWWAVTTLLGLLTWPLSFAIFRPLRDRGYLFSRCFGWLLCGWFLWMLASLGLATNTVRNSWLTVLLLFLLGMGFAFHQRRELRLFVVNNVGVLLISEMLYGAAFLFFVFIRLLNPDIWQPWFGGEKFMEFAFVNGILRSPYFPPVDPHFAGGYINYYYFGLYLVSYLIKLTGIYAEVAFNLAIAMLFAMTVSHSFGIAYSAIRRPSSSIMRLPGLVDNLGSARDPQGAIDNTDALKGHEFSTTKTESDDRLPGELGGSADVERHESVDAQEADFDLAQADSTAAEELGSHISEPKPPEPEPADKEKESSLPAWSLLPWNRGLAAALLAPLFVTLIGNLDGLGQIARALANMSDLNFRSEIPGLQYSVRAIDGLGKVIASDAQLPPYNFWDPSRVIPETINEFPYWSFLFADLHPHLIGIPLSVLFLGLLLTLFYDSHALWNEQWHRGIGLLLVFGLLLGALASVNLWELPTYTGLGVVGIIVLQFRHRLRIHWAVTIVTSVCYVGVAYLLFRPFFNHFTNVGASGLGLVRKPDEFGSWILIWGFLGFILISWIIYALRAPARVANQNGVTSPTGIERFFSLALMHAGRLPRLLYLHRLLVGKPTLTYLLGLWLWPMVTLVAVGLLWRGHSVLALCLFFLIPAFYLLWRRGQAADPGSLFTALLTVTGLAILAGTQVFYLKDFLQGGDWYRMNTLFKFFSQVWVIWGIAAAIALPRLWAGLFGTGADDMRFAEKSLADTSTQGGHPVTDQQNIGHLQDRHPGFLLFRIGWATVFFVLLGASLVYVAWGTPARLEQRFVGWQPEFGTLNGMDFMKQGTYTWPDPSNVIELKYDWLAIQWLLENVRGNVVIVESDVVGYYREGGSRIASLTGLSGLRGMHASEQRYGDEVGARDQLHREIWSNPDPDRTAELLDELDVSLVYVGQLEEYHHPEAVEKLSVMADRHQLLPLYENERVVIYGVPQNLANVATTNAR